ncbi:MAG: gliding motility-associated C-terminal domain-containing protein [Crocinitomicaceae bacterium]|nr:gliding motility-associated C-terminal domain-containing protein [Crocinitomicaceae bacterium]
MLKKSHILLLVTFLGFNFSNVEAQICLGEDLTVCVGTPVTITNCGLLGGGGASTAVILNNPTQVNLSDDSWSGVIPIGFNFSFYNNIYNQCLIGSNGLLSFNTANANGYCAWALGGVGALPTGGFATTFNSAMICMSDLNPGTGGNIFYQTIGTAPNRIFVVLYENTPTFGTQDCNYMATILRETSNQIDYHIATKQMVPTWNGGLAIQGAENNAGNVAHITPGRNNTQWTAFQDAKRMTPTAPGNTSAYQISTIPYQLVFNSTANQNWANTLGQTFPYNAGVLNIPSAQAGTVGYYLSVNGNGCSGAIGAASDTSWITGVSSAVGASSTPDICSSGAGTVTATALAGSPPFTFTWPALGANTQTVTGVSGGNYVVNMTDGMGCPSTAIVNVGDTPATFQGSFTLVSCPGGNDGTATAQMTPMLGNLTYQWDDPAGQTTQTAVGLTAGQYTCTVTSDIGCQGTLVVNVTEIPGMIGNITDLSNVTCNSGNDGMLEVTVTQGTAPYSYVWDNSSSTTNIANDLMVGPHMVTVTDNKGCVIVVNDVLTEPAALVITFITPVTQICPEDDILLSATGTGGSSPYTFTWFENGTQIGTGTSITVDPATTNTQYCVELSEVCGSPTTQECTTINFPTPIVPMALPDEFEKCVPDTFFFLNTSVNGGEIATTYWEFGDDPTHNLISNGKDSVSHYYDIVGTYSITMVTTSIYGCVYSDTIKDLIDVKPVPVANFSFSNNPATYFETNVVLQDASSNDVIYWSWYSPGSVPMTSNTENASFTFPEGVVGSYPVTLTVETALGCVDTIQYIMTVVEDILFYAPNAFTPDGDEHNQTWKPIINGIDIYAFELLIFNRWGEVIWENHDPNQGWDGTYNGKLVPAGSYAWVARVKKPQNDGKETFSGNINLLR